LKDEADAVGITKRSTSSGKTYYSNDKIDVLRRISRPQTERLRSEASLIDELFNERVGQIKDKKLKASVRKK
jgi:hypothetical protein